MTIDAINPRLAPARLILRDIDLICAVILPRIRIRDSVDGQKRSKRLPVDALYSERNMKDYEKDLEGPHRGEIGEAELATMKKGRISSLF